MRIDADSPEASDDGWYAVVNQDGTRPPLIFLHTWGGVIEHLRNLGPCLGADQPLYGIDPPDGVTSPFPARLDGWLRHFRDRVERLPVAPPYHLMGFSFGGVVALELARRLEAEGIAVAYVGLIDTVRPKINPLGLGPYLEYHLREFLDLAPERRRAYVRHRLRGGWHRVKLRTRNHAYRIAVRFGVKHAQPRTLGELKGMTGLRRSIHKSYLNYDAQPYERPVAIFSTDEGLRISDGDISLRWSRFFRGGFDLFRLGGEHLEQFDEARVSRLADAILRSLAAAAARGTLTPGEEAQPRPPPRARRPTPAARSTESARTSTRPRR